MNHLKSYNGFVNEARFSFGKKSTDASPNRELLKKQRQEILQKLSAIKSEIAKNNAKPVKLVDLNAPEVEVDAEVEVENIEVVAEQPAATPVVAALNIQLEALRHELRKVNKLLS